MYTVLDVSKYTSVTDYKKAANKVDGVIIRAGYRSYTSTGSLQEDSEFETHYTNFFGFTKIGVYWFTQAITREEANEEAEFLYSIIKGKNISFPIYIDSEYSNSAHDGRADNLSNEDRTTLIKVFLDRMKELGYKAGVYAEDTWFNEHLNYQDLLAEEYSIWVAKYSKILSPDIDVYDGWQYSITESLSGISGDANMSRFYKDVAGWREIRPVSDYLIGLDNYLFLYSGEENCPNVLTRSLTKDVDYSVSYLDNINAGTGVTIVNGINSYSGSVRYEFIISPIALIGECTIDKDSWVYTGQEIKPTISVGSMVSGQDFESSYSNNINVGIATATATGIGNYIGTKFTTFTITKASISNKTIKLLKTKYKYTGLPIIPQLEIEGLTLGTDYIITCTDNIFIGTATVQATGIGNWKDSISTTFEIESFKIKDYTMALEPGSFVYSGSECLPEVTVEGVDSSNYDITYPENPINVGIYTVTVTGKGEYEGTNSSNYIIDAKSISAFTPELEYYVHKYVSNYLEPVVTIEGLTENVDFTVEYTNNYNVGVARATIFGIGNYTSSTYAEFDIVESTISTCVGKFGRPSYRTPYRILDDQDFRLYASIHTYEKNEPLVYDYDYTVVKTKIEVKEKFLLYSFYVKGLSSFSGSDVFRFRILTEEPSTPIDTTDDGVYNFGDIDLGDETAVGNYDFKNIDGDETEEETKVIDGENYDFEIYSQIYLCDYDVDDGLNVDANGYTKDETGNDTSDNDDGVYNFGDIDLGDETAVGDYDFGDLDEGVSPENIANGDYDFNKFCKDKQEGYEEGTEFELKNTPMYPLYASKKVAFYATGTYYVYRSEVCNNKIRLTKLEDGVHEPVRASAWASMDDLENLSCISIGDAVIVNGEMFQYPNGTGGYTTKTNELMYVVGIEDNYYTYRYAIASSPINTKQGFIDSDSLTKIDE